MHTQLPAVVLSLDFFWEDAVPICCESFTVSSFDKMFKFSWLLFADHVRWNSPTANMHHKCPGLAKPHLVPGAVIKGMSPHLASCPELWRYVCTILEQFIEAREP